MSENQKATEAYHLMQYKCDTCGKLSLIWNSRDSVTPFCCSCACGGVRNHINWGSDVRMDPEYVPWPGYCDVFIDLSPERAKELAMEYDDKVRKLTESFVNDCCSVDIISSEEYGKLCGSGS